MEYNKWHNLHLVLLTAFLVTLLKMRAQAHARSTLAWARPGPGHAWVEPSHWLADPGSGTALFALGSAVPGRPRWPTCYP